MTACSLVFMERRIKALTYDARRNPATCKVARAWLDRAMLWAVRNGHTDIARMANDAWLQIL